MNRLKLAVLSLCAFALARPAGFSTTNSQAAEIASLQARLDAQERELADLRNAAALPAPEPELPSALAMLCKGAGVSLEDVRWRIAGGLEPDQAVQAAMLQQDATAAALAVAAPAAPVTKKGGK